MKIFLYIPLLFSVSIEVYYILFMLGIPTFFFWRWLFKKWIKVDQTRKIATWIATILVTPLIHIGMVIGIINILCYYPSKEFDQQKWLTEKDKRYELSEDIIETNLLIGKTHEEVRQLLGDESNNNQSNDWIYFLGWPPSVFGNDAPEALRIEFEDDKVVKVR
jgi:hypothetical protein